MAPVDYSGPERVQDLRLIRWTTPRIWFGQLSILDVPVTFQVPGKASYKTGSWDDGLSSSGELSGLNCLERASGFPTQDSMR